jgi:predicted dehydrogenase
MGQRWIREVLESKDVELLGVVDLEPQAARRAAATAGTDVRTATDLSELLTRVTVDAVINVTVPEAHFGINRDCLRANIPVLCEKPLVPTLTQAYLLAGEAEHHSTLLMASQSRRYYHRLSELREATSVIGAPFLVTAEFFRDPHFGGFRERMFQPLLLDMAIHAFDTARFLTGAEPVSVRCETFNPPWSWYDGDAAALATFEMTGGLRFAYTGSWCSGGVPTSWNGSWRLSGPRGSATWDGLGPPLTELADGVPTLPPVAKEPARVMDVPEEIAGALAEFVQAARSGKAPSGDIHANVWTLAMVQAAVQSASLSGRRVVVADLLDFAFREALASKDDAVPQSLRQWRGPLDRLTNVAGARRN